MNQFITVTETARRLGVSRPTVYRWISDGRLPAWRVGDSLRVDPDVVANFAQPTVEPVSVSA